MNKMVLNLADIMAGLHDSEGGEDSYGSKALPEAQIERLRDLSDRYSQPNPFMAGCIVTPRKESSARGHGTPHLVLETAPDRYVFEGAYDGSSAFGQRLNTRVALIGNDDKSHFFWMDHVDLETFATEDI